MFRSFIPLCFVSLGSAAAEPWYPTPDPTQAAAPRSAAVCSGGEARCASHVQIREDGRVAVFASPIGFTPQDIQSAYRVDPAAQMPATIAIVDAYGYPNLEADLGVYRAQFGLPPCTRANGCLTIVNQNGQATPLPAPSPTPSWTLETALDVDMVSATCPRCKIVVVQTNDDTLVNLFDGVFAAVAVHPAAVSNSWGATEASTDSSVGLSSIENALVGAAGVGLFAATLDSGYDLGGAGPCYPATSPQFVGVGGTELAKSATPRGWTEVAWPGAGSSCSGYFSKIATQITVDTGCALRASSDISAVAADTTGQGGIAIYSASQGGWLSVFGTSAATPIVATMLSALGLGAIGPDAIAGLASTFNDVTSGSNGTCTSALCRAGVGWDGPTGWGTPNADQLVSGGGGGDGGSFVVTSPQEDDTVAPGFVVSLQVMGQLTIDVAFDGVPIGSASTAPYDFPTPATTAPGPHEVTVTAHAGNSVVQIAIDVTVSDTGPGPDPNASGASDDGLHAGCSAGDPRGAIPLSLLVLLMLWRYRASSAATSRRART
jgi:hypothetical protein